MSEWPPKFKITPEGTAALFLLPGREATEENMLLLAELLKEYWRGGYDAAKRGEPREYWRGGYDAAKRGEPRD